MPRQGGGPVLGLSLNCRGLQDDMTNKKNAPKRYGTKKGYCM
jgi:hypothetical protein